MVVGRGCKTWWACNIGKSKSNTFINTNISSCLYQCYCLSSHFTIYLAKPLRKVHDVSNNRSNTDYDPQDIPLPSRMVNKSG